MTARKIRLLIVSREPAPYKTDLYNALVEVTGWDVLVFYCALHDWSPEGGHDFRDLPACTFASRVSNGRTLFSKLQGALSLVAICIRYVLASSDQLPVEATSERCATMRYA